MINSWKGVEIKVSIPAVINQWGPAAGRQTRGSPTHHSWLEMSKTLMASLCRYSSSQSRFDGFNLSSPITWGVQSEYNGPTLQPSSKKLCCPPSDMIDCARGNEWVAAVFPAAFPSRMSCSRRTLRVFLFIHFIFYFLFLQLYWVTHKASLHKHRVSEGALQWQTGCNLLSLNSNSCFIYLIFFYWLCWKACRLRRRYSVYLKIPSLSLHLSAAFVWVV